MRSLLFVISAVTILSCGEGSAPAPEINLEGYTVESIGSGVSKAYKTNAVGEIEELLYLSDGVVNGTWLIFYKGENAGNIKSLTSFSGGKWNGPYIEFSTRNQITKEIHYADGKKHGIEAIYKFGRPEKIAHYKNDQLDGVYKEFSSRGNIQKEINYKDGKQHGKLRYYNEDGQVTMEYEYKNGEKISGGIVETTPADPE